ncbi:MAG TPA: S8 family serine peptidase, partial [Micromonosporaceae bacterium]|nr:S8 family serine peptidase [Micromonosporaceae bacterium]
MDLRRTYRASLLAAALTGLVVASVPVVSGAPTAGAAAPAGAREPVIVILKNQHPELPARSAAAARKATVEREQAPLADRARRAGATDLKAFSVINGFAAKMTRPEAERLRADPGVAAVVPDRLLPVRGLTPQQRDAVRAQAASAAQVVPGTCPSDPDSPLLEPEALQGTHTAFRDPLRPQAQSIVDGTGVKVAWIADGLDPAHPDFVRADGTRVFTDYQDFSGTDPNLRGGGREAFGIASTVASQGRQAYDLSTFVNSAHPLPAGCTINVRGVAPGASLVGLNVFGSNNVAFSSLLVQAIEYAVTVAGVDVINESFGGKPYFGNNAYPTIGLDPVAMANDAAVAAGVTVVAATGSSGPTNTVGSPAVDPDVISVGAVTSYRIMAQTGYGGARTFATSWANGNGSAVSSGGVTALGRVPDLVAPGEDGWALCAPDPVRYADCVDFGGDPSPVQVFGGTSLAAAAVAGAAALVVEAYRRTHGGARPAPALVKQILTSSATDLALPAGEQGAGGLNTYRAVQLAMSVRDGNGSPARRGDTLLVATGDGDTQLTATGAAGSTHDLALKVTNTAPTSQTVTGRARLLGTTLSQVSGGIPLDVTAESAPSFVDGAGGSAGPVTCRYTTTTFTVPAGADHLEGHLAWPGGAANGQSLVQLALVGPDGSYQAHSAPQGPGNHGQVSVRNPAAGVWTAVFFAPASPTGFHGTVSYELTTRGYTTFGEVNPRSQTIAPGATATFHVKAKAGAQAGDLSAAVELSSSLGTRTSVPLTLRTLLATGPHGGAFAGAVTGGNGRDNPGAQSAVYYFDVPKGKQSLGVDLTLEGDPNQRVFAALTGPDKHTLSFSTNQALGPGGQMVARRSLQGYVRSPAPGRWILSLNVDNPVSGTAVRTPFTGHLRYDLVDVQASGVPRGTVPAGTPIPVTLRVTNTGAAPALFFTDPRSATLADYNLAVVP